MEHEETQTHRRSFLKLSISSFLFFLSLFLARIALHALYAWSNSAKNVICTPKLQRLVRCCCYVQLHVVLRKKKRKCFIVHLLMNQLLYSFSFLRFYWLVFMEIFASIRSWVWVICFPCLCVSDLTLKKRRIKSSSYGLPIDIALLLRVWVLARIAWHAL